MTAREHADTIRAALHSLATLAGNFDADLAAAPKLVNEQVATIAVALDALVQQAEKQEARMNTQGTHWVGCWQSHVDCAVVRVERLETALRKIERHAVYFDDEIDPKIILNEARSALGQDT